MAGELPSREDDEALDELASTEVPDRPDDPAFPNGFQEGGEDREPTDS